MDKLPDDESLAQDPSFAGSQIFTSDFGSGEMETELCSMFRIPPAE
jgi:hypothetical protein